MANALTSTGLTLSTRAELISQLTTAYQNIYGADINLSSDSPDGQMMNIFVQMILDNQDLLLQIYNSFDPDNAIGNVLDQRVAINGIQRQAGTYTVTNITIVTSQACNLYGLDQTAQDVFTVSDNAGTQWVLQTTQYVSGAGTYVFSFQAALPGATYTTPNTITVPVSIVLGVTSINNPSTYTSLGLNEETDAALKIRRSLSTSLASQGFYKGLLAALLNINGVTSAFVYENTTSATNSDGVPGHSIWVIVAGTGSSADVANAIYAKRNAGCGMFGATLYNVTQVDGTLFPIYFDTVQTQNVFVQFTTTSIDGVNLPNIAAIKTYLAANYVPSVYQELDINHLATMVQNADPNCLVTNAGFSTGQTQTLTLSGVAASGTFYLNYNGQISAAINWNDSIATIQTKVQAMSGLSTALVTGSIASQSLVFNLTAISSVQGLIYVTTNTLQTSAPAAISFSYNNNYQTTLLPTSKKYQFVSLSANTVIIPMILSPYSTITATPITVASLASYTFTGLGGYGTLTYAFTTNNSGGSITSGGVYTAGSTKNVNDTIKVTDVLGNTASAVISVV